MFKNEVVDLIRSSVGLLGALLGLWPLLRRRFGTRRRSPKRLARR